ncbi:MAG TPA: DUF1501 domain-containing protein [Solirubrobacteraceae bacterium]|jgi:uncharacterized protein (DUF1501 family)
MSCEEHTRAQLLRRAAAGRGLPGIEPGMPAPAGTGLTRRSLVLSGLGLSLTLFGGRALAPEAMTEAAMAAAAPDQPVLVSVFLSGGVDTLSLLPPLADARYNRTLRPNLLVDRDSTLPLRGSTKMGWHPEAAAFKRLHDRGRMVLLPSVGYAGPNQSHFTSRHFYEVGATDPNGRTGWLGRLIDVIGDEHNPIQGLTLGRTLSPALATESKAVAAVDAPAAYDFDTPGIYGPPYKTELLRAFGELSALSSTDPVLGLVRETYRDAVDLRTALARPLPAGTVAYPDNPLGAKLRDLARLLGAGLPIRCAAIDAHADFDTHANQADVFAGQVAGVGAALEAFQADLEARSAALAGRVLTLAWSEFGRRPEENGSVGTDHGAAGLAMVLGTRVRGTAAGGGFIGAYPGLGVLDPDGNLRRTADFRGLYCSVLEQWFDQDAAQLIPGAAKLPRYAVVV